MLSFSSSAFSSVSFSVIAFALASGNVPPDLIQRPGLTSSNWTLLNPPIRRPIENDEALLLAMNMI